MRLWEARESARRECAVLRGRRLPLLCRWPENEKEWKDLAKAAAPWLIGLALAALGVVAIKKAKDVRLLPPPSLRMGLV